jgi:hypothetical protein
VTPPAKGRKSRRGRRTISIDVTLVAYTIINDGARDGEIVVEEASRSTTLLKVPLSSPLMAGDVRASVEIPAIIVMPEQPAQAAAVPSTVELVIPAGTEFPLRLPAEVSDALKKLAGPKLIELRRDDRGQLNSAFVSKP